MPLVPEEADEPEEAAVPLVPEVPASPVKFAVQVEYVPLPTKSVGVIVRLPLTGL